MRRGTTPTHVFKTDVDLTDAAVIWLTYKVDGETVIEKNKDELTVTPEAVSITLTQDETLSLLRGMPVYMQIRARFHDGLAIASNIMQTAAGEILRDGVI